jgi:hypothetical protein
MALYQFWGTCFRSKHNPFWYRNLVFLHSFSTALNRTELFDTTCYEDTKGHSYARARARF